jgi:cell division transport system ATP-binding protein
VCWRPAPRRPPGLSEHHGVLDGALRIALSRYLAVHDGMLLHASGWLDGGGRAAAFFGVSGAGKSTLVRLLIRDEAPSSGRIFVEGQEISRMARRKLPKLRRKFGIVFQDYKLLTRRTVAQNVAFALQVTRPGQRHLREKVEEVLWIVGLEDKLDTFPDELSGGEQQRVAIARALVHRPRIFIADEPTGNLDPDTSWGIVQLLLQINHRGTTVLMATHNREVVDLVRRRVIAIEDGRIIRDEAQGSYLREGEATI